MVSIRGAELIYWVFALVGSFFFLFRLAAMVVAVSYTHLIFPLFIKT